MPAATDAKKESKHGAKSPSGGGAGGDGKDARIAQMALMGKAVMVAGGAEDKSDTSGFTKVENKRAEAAANRKAKKAKEEADKKIQDLKATGISENAAKAQLAAETKKAKDSDDDAAPAKLPAPNQKKKKSKKSSSRLTISSAGQLAQLISAILDSTPLGTRPQISYIGDRIHEMTNHSWKKKYQPIYGSLRDFVASRAEFVITDTQVVMTKADYDAKQRAVSVPTKRKKKSAGAAGAAAADGASPRSAAAAASPSPSSSSGGSSRSKRFRAELAKANAAAGGDGDDDSDGVGAALRIVFIVLLMLVIMLVVLLSLDTGVSNQARSGIDRIFNLQWN